MSKPYKVELEDGTDPISMHDYPDEAQAAADAYNETQPPDAPFALAYWWDNIIEEWQIV